MRISILLGALLCLLFADCYKILVYSPRFSQSINNFLGNIADTLVEAGHHVTTLIPIVNPHLRDGTHKSKKVYVQPTEDVRKISEEILSHDADFFAIDSFSLVQGYMVGKAWSEWVNAQCKGILEEEELLKKLKQEKYDVMIVEIFDACGTALSHIIKPKSLITSSGSVPIGKMTEEIGLDTALSYNPSMLISHFDAHSFWSRLTNIYAEFVVQTTWRTTPTQVNDLFHAQFEDFPGVKEISSHAAYTLVNCEPLIDYAAPTLNRVHIGGIGAKTPKKLDAELDRLFALRNKTVLISFGSVVIASQLPLHVKQSIVETVSRFPEVTFLWKYEKPEDDFAKSVLASTPNLHMLKWSPQNDILADDRLTAFITHGGMASTQETAVRGKAGLFIPIMGDQSRNAGMMEKNGLGKVFGKTDLFDSEKLYAAVKDLLENDSYHKNAKKMAAMIQKKPFSAREILVKTVEFAAEFGPSPSLRPQSFDMNWIEYNNVDIIAFSTVTLFLLTVVAAKLIIFCTKRIIHTKLKSD